MPNETKSATYALAHRKRIASGEAKDPQNASRIVIEPSSAPEGKQDEATGVTDPAKLLKMGSQRIDRNIYTPDQLKDAGILKGRLDPVRVI